jgi:hypothetical protein
MRLSELLGAEVTDQRGRSAGKVHDVRPTQDGPVIGGFGARLRLAGLLVGQRAWGSGSATTEATCMAHGWSRRPSGRSTAKAATSTSVTSNRSNRAGSAAPARLTTSPTPTRWTDPPSATDTRTTRMNNELMAG